jgi:hypothetical protein
MCHFAGVPSASTTTTTNCATMKPATEAGANRPVVVPLAVAAADAHQHADGEHRERDNQRQ